MGGTSMPPLVIAASDAGALGSLGASYMSPQEITTAVATIRAATSRPFAVNLFAGGWHDDAARAETAPMLELLRRWHAEVETIPAAAPVVPPCPYDAQIEAVIAARVPVFSFTFGIPRAEHLTALRESGTYVIGTATTVAEARALEAAGVDAIVAQGSEAGAHRGTFLGEFDASLVGTMALVPQIVDAVRVPVIASGGIMDGRGIVAALALGAAGAQLGTAFLTSEESSAPEAHKAAVLAARDDATRITRAFSGRPARGIVNAFMREVEDGGIPIPPFPLQNMLTRPLRATAARAGDARALSLWAGQAAALARREPAAALVARLVREMDETTRALVS